MKRLNHRPLSRRTQPWLRQPVWAVARAARDDFVGHEADADCAEG